MFNQDIKSFLKSKTNISALVGIGYGVYLIKLGDVGGGVQAVQVAIAALTLKDAIAR